MLWLTSNFKLLLLVAVVSLSLSMVYYLTSTVEEKVKLEQSYEQQKDYIVTRKKIDAITSVPRSADDARQRLLDRKLTRDSKN